VGAPQRLRFISHHTYWRRGVVLERDDHRAFVKADIEDGIISIAIAGRADEWRGMLDLIRADFERIHKTMPKLRVAEKVPIPDRPDVLVDYVRLVRLSRLGERSYNPEGMDQHISVGALLGEIETSGYRARRKDPLPLPEEKTPDPKMQPLIHPLLVFVVAVVLVSVIGFVTGGGLAVPPIAVVGAILVVVLVRTLGKHRAGRFSENAFMTVVKEALLSSALSAQATKARVKK
jgi:internalin A